MVDYEKLFASFFQEAADIAASFALRYFRQEVTVENKEDGTLVTMADRKIEEALREKIRQTFPTHGMIGEEFGPEEREREFVWVIDPIDGTNSFVTGRPLFGTILGLMHEGKPVVGLIDQPVLRERWFGIHDRFTTYNGKMIRVAPPKRLEKARCYSAMNGFSWLDYQHNHEQLCRTVNCSQSSCDCYAYGLLAMGCIDLIIEMGLKLHDVVGVVPIIQGAQGFISGWRGEPVDQNFQGRIVAASCQKLAEQAAAMMTSP